MKWISFLLLFWSGIVVACEGEDFPSNIISKDEPVATEKGEVFELYVQVPTYWKNQKLQSGIFVAESGEVNVSFIESDSFGWSEVRLKGLSSFYRGSKVIVYYRSLGRYSEKSKGFSFPLCHQSYEIKFNM